VTKKNRRITLFILFPVILGLLILIVIRLGGSKLFAKEALSEAVANPVSAAVVKTGTISNTLSFTGDLHADEEALVYSMVNGRVVKYNHKEGDKVSKGTPLVTLEREETWDQFKPVIVESPISGTVATNYLTTGERATPQTPLSLVVGGGGITVYIKVPDKELSRIKKDMKAELTVTTAPGVVYEGTVERVSPVIDRTTRTSQVEIHISDADGPLRSGMFGNVTIILEEKDDALLIPAESVIFEKEGKEEPYCFVIEKNIAKKRALTVGITQKDMVEVVSGLKAGDKVATLGKENLSDGTAVRIVESF
jgi:multidrug efflux pump subunit AcrA (membrane-fusion protein)